MVNSIVYFRMQLLCVFNVVYHLFHYNKATENSNFNFHFINYYGRHSKLLRSITIEYFVKINLLLANIYMY